jgi:hypothetical protein
MRSFLLSWLLHCLIMGRSSITEAAIPTNLYWNSTNPLFDQEEVVLGVNEDNHPWQYDQVNLICPSGPNSTEEHIVYSVTREEWEDCEVRQTKPRIIAICDQPKNFMYFTITFRSFSPSPQQMEFKPGRSYYLISTATEADLYSLSGGWCRSHNMRLVFRVAETEVELSVSGRRPTMFWSKYWGSGVPGPRHHYSRDRGRMDRDYSDEGEGENNSGYEAGFSENQSEMDNQGYAEGRTYAEERGYNAEKQAGPYQDHRGNALMLQSNAAQSLQVSALILALITVKVLKSIC